MATVYMNGFQWDDDKNRQNIKSHKISFKEATKAFRNTMVDVPDTRQKHFEEDRTNSLGVIKDGGRERHVHITHTERNGDIRLISAREAKPQEVALYHEHAYQLQHSQQQPDPSKNKPSQEQKAPEKAKLEFFSDIHKPKTGIKH